MLSDILGDEDHLGDMDFKVTGTKDGITATQMDIKVDGLSYEVLAKALEQARVGRMHILGKLTECIAEPRADYRPFVPRIVQITIPQDMIGAVIGPGGKVIQDIQKTTGTTITITETDNKGVVDIFGLDKEAMDAALYRIKAIVAIRRSAMYTTARSVRSCRSVRSSRSCPARTPCSTSRRSTTSVSRRWRRPA